MSDPTISTAELHAALALPDLRVVDASWFLDGRDAHAGWLQAHIPGAVFFDIDANSDHASPLPHMLPRPEAFGRAAGALGIAAEDRIVVYDQQGLFSAARVWWTFRVMGAERVQVLDGGLPKWRGEGRPLERGAVRPTPATFDARLRPELVRRFEAVRDELAAGGQVVDARPAARFRGEAAEPRQGLRSGHMPGSRNVPFASVLTPDATLKSRLELEQVFAAAGVSPDRPVTASCGSGVTAAIVLLALARLGNERAAIYDGAWTEWGARPDAEVATGP